MSILPTRLLSRYTPMLLLCLSFGLGACQSELGAVGSNPSGNGTSSDDSFAQFCAQHPTDDACVYCQAHPQDCEDGSGSPSDFCQQNPQDPTCQGGGNGQPGSFEEYCQQNPQDQDCVYCQQNPQDAWCMNPDGGGTGTDPNCQQNPQAPGCQGGGQPGSFEEYCQQNPQDQDCVYCQQNPQDAWCMNPDGGGTGTDPNCQQNPQDPNCQGGGQPGSFQEYCQQNPQDQDCVYCAQNPQDQYCQE